MAETDRHLVCINYGCGIDAPEEMWLNYDVSPTLRMQRVPVLGRFVRRVEFPKHVRIGDIRRGLPHADGTVDRAYCSHVLEHLSRTDCRNAIRRTFALLKPGGIFRFVLPDFEALARRYTESIGDPEAVHTFMKKSHLGYNTRPGGLNGIVRSVLANNMHLWMWDEPAMAVELREVGFTDVRRAQFGDSNDPAFALVESEPRWEGHLGFHAVKPGGEGTA